MKQYERVFVSVSVDEKYPEDETDDYFIVDSVDDKAVVSGSELNYHRVAKVTHWLEELTNRIVMTPEELKKLLVEYTYSSIGADHFLKSKGIEIKQ